MEANVDLSQHAGVAGFTLVVDGDYVPDVSDRLFLEGRYHKTLTSVIAANNEHEVRLPVKKLIWSLLPIRKDRVAMFCLHQKMSL